MSYTELADTLENRLNLRLPPVALAFVDAPPPGVARTDAVVPSSCAFWRQAESEVFYAPAAAHLNCALGAMVMGFDLPAPQMDTLQAEVKMMCDLAYVRGEEVERVPKVAKTSAGIVYGPLRRFPLRPDVALVWGSPQQAMVLSETCGLINWAGVPAGILGRPGCGSIPTALGAGRAVQSLGCTGMRLNTNIGPELSLMVLPGKVLETLAQDLERTCRLHAQLEDHYRAKAARLSAA